MSHHARPTLIGVVQLPSTATETERRQARLALARRANDEGYALLETFEVSGDASSDESIYQQIEELAAREDAAALMASGGVDRGRLEGVAERVRMRVLHVVTS